MFLEEILKAHDLRKGVSGSKACGHYNSGLRSKTYAKNAFGYLHVGLKLQPDSWALAYLGLASQIGQKVPSVKHIQQTY